jgi:hypothetical protein
MGLLKQDKEMVTMAEGAEFMTEHDINLESQAPG